MDNASGKMIWVGEARKRAHNVQLLRKMLLPLRMTVLDSRNIYMASSKKVVSIITSVMKASQANPVDSFSR